MLGTVALQHLVCRVHRQEQRHQYDLGNEYQIGIFAWPAVQLLHVQPANFHNVSSYQEDDTCYQHKRSQYFKETYQVAI